MNGHRQQLEKYTFWALLVVLLGFCALLLAPFAAALFLSVVLVLASEPLHQRFLSLFRGRRHLAASATLLVVILFLALPITVITSMLIEEIVHLARVVSASPHVNLLDPQMGGDTIATLSEFLRSQFGLDIDLSAWFQKLVVQTAQYLYHYSPKVVIGTTHFVITGFISFFLTYFLLVDGPALYHYAIRLSSLKTIYEQELATEIRETVRGCLYGSILNAVGQGVLSGLGFWWAGLGNAPLLGMATFLTAFIPVIGAASVWLPAVIFLIAKGSLGSAVFLFFYGLIFVSGFDHIAKVLFIRGYIKIHPMVLFLAILGGLKLFGPLGILVGPTLIAVLLATLKIYKRDFLDTNTLGSQSSNPN